LAALAFRRWEMLVVVVTCAVLREQYRQHPWAPDAQYRLLSACFSYGGLGLLLGEMARNRRLTLRHYQELKEQSDRRQTAEAQLGALVESSPAGILTVSPGGLIEIANSAAEQMFAVGRGELIGRRAGELLPVIDDLVAQGTQDLRYRTTTTCLGRRANGEGFHAYLWFSTLPSPAGNGLAAILIDSSEDLRDSQESSRLSILRSTRVLVGSVSHEIRNLAAAILMVHANLGRIPGVAESEDYNSLATLAHGLARLATVELGQTPEQELAAVDITRLVEEFCIITGPSIEAISGELVREIPSGLPLALGDYQGMIQVLMNLSRNSVRAMDEMDEARPRRLVLRASHDAQHVYLRVIDSGPGLQNPALAFQPFQPGANATGLGLFVSRAIIRACQGELYCEPSAEGCVMVAKLKIYPVDEASMELNDTEVPA
jgi:signal transduction histidine kinase